MMQAPHNRCEGLFLSLFLFILRFLIFIILSDVRLGVLIHIRLFLIAFIVEEIKVFVLLLLAAHELEVVISRRYPQRQSRR